MLYAEHGWSSGKPARNCNGKVFKWLAVAAIAKLRVEWAVVQHNTELFSGVLAGCLWTVVECDPNSDFWDSGQSILCRWRLSARKSAVNLFTYPFNYRNHVIFPSRQCLALRGDTYRDSLRKGGECERKEHKGRAHDGNSRMTVESVCEGITVLDTSFIYGSLLNGPVQFVACIWLSPHFKSCYKETQLRLYPVSIHRFQFSRLSYILTPNTITTLVSQS